MELVWLEDLSALAEYGSFVRAAEARHVTQPAFSRRVRSMETWMGVELFVRTPQGATLTEAGRQILPSAQEAARNLYRPPTPCHLHSFPGGFEAQKTVPPLRL